MVGLSRCGNTGEAKKRARQGSVSYPNFQRQGRPSVTQEDCGLGCLDRPREYPLTSPISGSKERLKLNQIGVAVETERQITVQDLQRWLGSVVELRNRYARSPGQEDLRTDDRLLGNAPIHISLIQGPSLDRRGNMGQVLVGLISCANGFLTGFLMSGASPTSSATVAN